MAMQPLRSVLYLPANRASAVAKARASAADAVILDLEDAVAPEAKREAREAALAAAREGGFGPRQLVVRCNAPDSAWGRADLAALAGSNVSAVLIPKVAGSADLATCHESLDPIPLWAMVESCAAFLDLGAICAFPGLTTLVIGTNDLASEMRCSLDRERTAVLPLLTQALVAARANGLAVIDGVFNDLEDDAAFASECVQGAALGFDGKTVIHPRQIADANLAFAPTHAALRQAHSIVAAFATSENRGKGVITVGGRMIERLHLREAERLIAMQCAIDARG